MIYGEAGRNWRIAHDNYELANAAFEEQAPQVGLSYLAEAILYMQQAVNLGQLTFPSAIRAEAKQLIETWYELFISLYERLIDA